MGANNSSARSVARCALTYDHRADLINELSDLRLAAGGIRALLTRGDRGKPRLDALQIRKDGVVDAIGAAVLALESKNMLLALRARRVVELERPRVDTRVRFGARDLQRRRRGRNGHEGGAAIRFGFPRHGESSSGP